MDKLRLLFNISRPISWINTAYPFAAGYIILGGGLDARLFITTIFFLIPYNLLMYGVNDVFDYESDIRNPRKGSVEGAITPKKFHPLILWSAALSSMPFVVALIVLGPPISAVVLTILLFFVVAYSVKGLRFKEIPLLDSVTSSLHFVGPLVYSYGLLGSQDYAWLAAGAFFAWGMASHALGAIQDIIPDREAGLRSIATVFGARATIWFVIAMYILAVVLVWFIGESSWLVSIAGLSYVINVTQFYKITDASSLIVHRAWKRFLWINYFVGGFITIFLIINSIF